MSITPVGTYTGCGGGSILHSGGNTTTNNSARYSHDPYARCTPNSQSAVIVLTPQANSSLSPNHNGCGGGGMGGGFDGSVTNTPSQHHHVNRVMISNGNSNYGVGLTSTTNQQQRCSPNIHQGNGSTGFYFLGGAHHQPSQQAHQYGAINRSSTSLPPSPSISLTNTPSRKMTSSYAAASNAHYYSSHNPPLRQCTRTNTCGSTHSNTNGHRHYQHEQETPMILHPAESRAYPSSTSPPNILLQLGHEQQQVQTIKVSSTMPTYFQQKMQQQHQHQQLFPTVSLRGHPSSFRRPTTQPPPHNNDDNEEGPRMQGECDEEKGLGGGYFHQHPASVEGSPTAPFPPNNTSYNTTMNTSNNMMMMTSNSDTFLRHNSFEASYSGGVPGAATPSAAARHQQQHQQASSQHNGGAITVTTTLMSADNMFDSTAERPTPTHHHQQEQQCGFHHRPQRQQHYPPPLVAAPQYIPRYHLNQGLSTPTITAKGGSPSLPLPPPLPSPSLGLSITVGGIALSPQDPIMGGGGRGFSGGGVGRYASSPASPSQHSPPSAVYVGGVSERGGSGHTHKNSSTHINNTANSNGRGSFARSACGLSVSHSTMRSQPSDDRPSLSPPAVNTATHSNNNGRFAGMRKKAVRQIIPAMIDDEEDSESMSMVAPDSTTASSVAREGAGLSASPSPVNAINGVPLTIRTTTMSSSPKTKNNNNTKKKKSMDAFTPPLTGGAEADARCTTPSSSAAAPSPPSFPFVPCSPSLPGGGSGGEKHGQATGSPLVLLPTPPPLQFNSFSAPPTPSHPKPSGDVVLTSCRVTAMTPVSPSHFGAQQHYQHQYHQQQLQFSNNHNISNSSNSGIALSHERQQWKAAKKGAKAIQSAAAAAATAANMAANNNNSSNSHSCNSRKGSRLLERTTSSPTQQQHQQQQHSGVNASSNSNATTPIASLLTPSKKKVKTAASQPYVETPESLARRIVQREKQIAIGKGTEGYTRYTAAVRIADRKKGHPKHPVTPRADGADTKRAFDRIVGLWRTALHLWDADAEEGKGEGDKEEGADDEGTTTTVSCVTAHVADAEDDRHRYAAGSHCSDDDAADEVSSTVAEFTY